MSRFLGNIAARAMGQAAVVQPRPRSRHEDVPLRDPFQNQGSVEESQELEQVSEIDARNHTVEAEDSPRTVNPDRLQEESNPSPDFVQPRSRRENRIQDEKGSEEQNNFAQSPVRPQADFVIPVIEESKKSIASDRFSETVFSEAYAPSSTATNSNSSSVSNQESAGPWFALESEAFGAIPAKLDPPIPFPSSGTPFSALTPAPSRQSPTQPKEMVVQVHIGRIEVKAPVDPTPKLAPTPSRASGLSLQQYLARRNGSMS